MECPKCGAPQVEGSEVCPSCGIYFSKMRRATMSQPLPESEDSPAPPWMVFAIIGVVLFLGAAWLKHRRAHHVEVNPDDQINAINHAIVNRERQVAQAELDQSYRNGKTQYPFRTLPDGWYEQRALDDINKCDALAPMHAESVGEIRGDDKTFVVFFKAASTESPNTWAEGSAVYSHMGDNWQRYALAIETDGHVRYLTCH